MINERDVRQMALDWLDGEIDRLKAVRAELTAAIKVTPERQREVRAKILASAATEKRVHWTQLPENREKALANVRRAAAAKAKSDRAKTKVRKAS